MRKLTWSGALGVAALALAACGSNLGARTGDGPGTTTTVSVTTTTLEQPGWTIVSASHGTPLADRRTFHLADGAVVTVFRFRAGRVTFDLHTGSEDPPGLAASAGPSAGPSISAREAPLVIGGFNGGFKVASGSGGVVLDGHRDLGLRRGDATFVIDRDGVAHVGVWGRDLPYRGERVYSARQNLQLLVVNRKPSPLIGDLAPWGDTLGGVAAPARSAVGEDARGDILFAASMQALPGDLAVALIDAGAVRAMEMDINPYWVQLAIATRPGGPLIAGIPGQERPGNQYQLGWTRDFVVVLARRT